MDVYYYYYVMIILSIWEKFINFGCQVKSVSNEGVDHLFH